MTNYYGENDGYGTIGHSYRCEGCGRNNRFVDESEEQQVCENCGEVNLMEHFGDYYD